MRPSLFLIAVFVSLALLLALPGTCHAQTVTDILDFNDSSFGYPNYVTLVQVQNGNLYGSTTAAPFTSFGTLFGITPTGEVAIEYTGFDYVHGAYPCGGMTLATNGTLYGTTEYSGATADTAGVIYNFTTSGSYNALYQFVLPTGSFPCGPPIQGSDGNFYGASNGIHVVSGTPSTIYQYVPTTGAVNLIHEFGLSVGLQWPLIQAIDGNLYGAAGEGGANRLGEIFGLTTSGVLQLSYNFPGGAGGQNPNGPLLQLRDGNFYGTVCCGGTGGGGFIFKITPAGALSVLYNFNATNGSAAYPGAGLTLGSDGNLYGVTGGGGTYGMGTLYRVTPNGKLTLLYSFPAYASTNAPLMQHTNGKFYGVSTSGGANNYGMVYTLNMGLHPFITFVQPLGAIGQTAQILGNRLLGTSSVTFNGVAAASFSVESDTYMTAVVPTAATTGKVVVTTPGGALTSNVNFRIIN